LCLNGSREKNRSSDSSKKKNTGGNLFKKIPEKGRKLSVRGGAEYRGVRNQQKCTGGWNEGERGEQAVLSKRWGSRGPGRKKKA